MSEKSDITLLTKRNIIPGKGLSLRILEGLLEICRILGKSERMHPSPISIILTDFSGKQLVLSRNPSIIHIILPKSTGFHYFSNLGLLYETKYQWKVFQLQHYLDRWNTKQEIITSVCDVETHYHAWMHIILVYEQFKYSM